MIQQPGSVLDETALAVFFAAWNFRNSIGAWAQSAGLTAECTLSLMPFGAAAEKAGF